MLCKHWWSIAVTHVLCFGVAQLRGQTFSGITTGALVSDGGASRSVNWVDFDNDGDLDLFVSNGLRATENHFCYRNDGPPNFTFTKIIEGALVTTKARAVGSSWGDFDNDGDLDAYVTTWYGDKNLFYENSNASFTRVMVGAIANDGSLSETCAWGDFDNDGDLDLYVTNSGDVNSTGPQRNSLYRNNGDKTFTKITSGAPVTDAHYSRGANWVDYDDDGDLDLFVANEENQVNDFYRNQLAETGVASFAKITSGNIVTDVASSWTGSWGDYDNDGDLDLFVGNQGNRQNVLYQNNGNGTFTRITTGVLVTDPGYAACSGWGDFDNDGDLDLYVTNAYGPGQLKNSLYRNLLRESNAATFEKITTEPASNDLGYSYGFSWGDYDNDGDLDLFVARTLNENQNNAFYMNASGSQQSWLELDCHGTASNRSALGAKVRVKATVNGIAFWQRRDIAGQEGYCAQNLRVHFGLGEATVVDSVLITWPSGKSQVLTRVPARQLLTITEPGNTTGVKDAPAARPQGYRLDQNYPNPFNPATQIAFSVPVAAAIQLKIFDTRGNEVRTLMDDFASAGAYAVSWDGTDAIGKRVASGVYFYRMRAAEFQQTRKMIVME